MISTLDREGFPNNWVSVNWTSRTLRSIQSSLHILFDHENWISLSDPIQMATRIYEKSWILSNLWWSSSYSSTWINLFEGKISITCWNPLICTASDVEFPYREFSEFSTSLTSFLVESLRENKSNYTRQMGLASRSYNSWLGPANGAVHQKEFRAK